QPTPFASVRDAVKAAPLGSIDVAWLADTGFRALVATLFDPPTTEDAVQGIGRVTLTVHPARRWSGALLLGWVASCLGADHPRRIGERRWKLQRAAGYGTPLELGLELDD